MVLEEETNIVQSKNAYTQYLTIPSSLVRDSQYPFKNGDKVKITVDPTHRILMITPAEKPDQDSSARGHRTK
jgi:hypothetical protein